MNRKPVTQGEVQGLFDDLRRRAQDDSFLAKTLGEIEQADYLLGDDKGGNEEETFRLPYSSMMLKSEEDWN